MKNVLIGVSGGIACYKTIEIVNQLKKDGYNVNVIMTKAAQEFVRPLTFQAMSGNVVVTDMFEPANWDMKHIELAKNADIFAVVPATANIIGKIASGIADDMLSTTLMVAKCPILIAPAMNTAMYENAFVQANLQKLTSNGYIVLKTQDGLLACGDEGKGKLLPFEDILKEIKDILNNEKRHLKS
ncbi:MAG: bifunctional phosphopantothenoylcysteine decarboxylase/phosphopantothenate--cysteine ligase CoaBC [Dysgonamonadaceae bacterium]|nr:bifunctional phosphopantothenoylcysteine decarboxylase/phosphopantothenate--cysteine ligase CoaBC [Dysgonamonadaceae bacterium]MDD4727400.1 bifunctional phosphopantothenoylcysteine decarboxylase/phosphopantothenate--cysteine ligase CoaBC [Dysgonamonadaceae bacterium]